jgi:hypothetical protein
LTATNQTEFEDMKNISQAAFVGPMPELCGPVKPAAKRGRPAKYASEAERQKAWRANNAVKTLRIDGKAAATIAKLAEMYDCDETHVVNNLLRFALANRNWVQAGVGGWAIKDARFTAGKRTAPVEPDLSALDAEFPLVK